MLRRNLFVVVVLLGLILSAAFTSWTQDTSAPGKASAAGGRSWPPDLTNYSRPAILGDLAVSKAGKGFSSPGFFVTEVPDSPFGEPDIAINPQNPNEIVIFAGFGGFNWNSNAYNFVSNDGGITWTKRFQIPPPNNAPNTAGCPCDATQDYGLDGNLYGAYLTGNTDVFSASNTNPFANLFSYFLVGPNAQLTDFNGTLGKADQPWLLTNVDPFTPGQTNTYVGYDDFNAVPTVITRVSAAFGTSPPDFTTDNPSGSSANGGVINPGHRLANDPRTGAMYSLYQTCVSCGGSPKLISYKLNRSLDAGTTWTLNGSGTGISVATGVTVQPTPKFGTVNALLGGIDHAAVNPTTGDVFVVYGDANGAGGNAIFIKQITFNSATPTAAILGTPHQVSLPGAQAALPSVAVAPDGTVGVLYTSFDGFSVDGFPIFSGHFAYSTDAGVTFTDKTLLTFLSPAKEDGNINDSQRVLGDYQQLKVVNDPPPANAGATFYGVFTGNGAALGESIADNDAIFFKVTLAPQINLNPNPLDIGNVCEGSTGSAELDVSDTGADNLLISGITRISGSTDISLATGPTYPVNISPDASFSFNFKCTPTTAGVKSATFNILSNDPANPVKPVIVTCTTGSLSLNESAGLTFPPTVIQTTAACSAKLGVPITNTGVCPVKITAVGLTQGSVPKDYSLTGLPGLPVTLDGGGHQLGSGDLDLVFAPFTVARESTVTVDITFENNAVTHSTTTDHVPFCGEGVHRGIRVLVTNGGAPVAKVKLIQLQKANGPEQDSGIFTIRSVKNASLQTVTGVAPCPTFSFHTEFGGVSNPFQLKDGTYRVRATIKVGKKIKHKIVRTVVDPCTFNALITVAF